MKIVQFIAIILLLAFPYSYFAMFIQYEVGNILGYVTGLIVFIIVTVWAALQRQLIPFILGALATMVTSYAYAGRPHANDWETMFFSFTPAQYSLLLSIIYVGLMSILFYLLQPKKNASSYRSYSTSRKRRRW